ncbi:PREDICTED: purple acid [Prunus dulcis]|uniref:PREDICTED: purple acid n=1 Tax=Prunus dulcis TaxID=3755 RepID=A0A5E4G7F6_PRUDU|nr:PREDICTED: purple acid [Prunus dulcis]
MKEKAFSGGGAIDDDHGSSWSHDWPQRRRSPVHGEAIGESMPADSQNFKALPAISVTRPNRSSSPAGNLCRFMDHLISKAPIMVIEGNREIEEQVENKTFVAYSSRFAFPSEESGSSSTLYYSFNAGGFILLCLESTLTLQDRGNNTSGWSKIWLMWTDPQLHGW